MNKSYIIIYFFIATLFTHTAQATRCTIHNKSGYTIEIYPSWCPTGPGCFGGRREPGHSIEPGGFTFYDWSFGNAIKSITWRQLTQSQKDSTCYKEYSKAIDPKIATMNNAFEIFNDGSYRIEQEGVLIDSGEVENSSKNLTPFD